MIDIKAPLPVQGDWDELVQVVQNLVENAIKYAAHGKVDRDLAAVGVGEDCRTVRCATMAGHRREHIPRLTERFYRISVQESRSRGGTGLGLAIVKHILNRHRGQPASSARNSGAGSTFTIRIPWLPKIAL